MDCAVASHLHRKIDREYRRLRKRTDSREAKSGNEQSEAGDGDGVWVDVNAMDAF